MTRILVLPTVLYGNHGPYRQALEAAGVEIVYPPNGKSPTTVEALLPLLDGVSGALAGMEPFTREVMAQCPQLRAIARMGVGYDAIDVPAATELKVAVAITPGTNEISVAEHAIALLCGVMRGFPGRDAEVRGGDWKRKSLPRMSGKTMGLVGLGRIGRAVVPRARGLGMKVIAHDPYPDAEFAQKNEVRLVSFNQLLAESDIVSLHLPATTITADLINSTTLAMMKPGSVLINTARGNLVDEDAVAEALRSGHLSAAGLDAFKIEPLPLDSPLLSAPNVLLAPHMGGLDHESEVAMSLLAAQCLVKLNRGEWPEGCVVNDQIRSDWKW
jgi:phosphoglycerate dehydrogenase-like enzyme